MGGGDEIFISGEYSAEDVIPEIPEPATLLLFGLGSVMLRKRKG